MQTLSFHFDFLSPYAYFASRWVGELCDEFALELVLEPTIFGVVLAHHGHLGPAEIPSKREWVFRDVLRIARREGLTLRQPHTHPFNSVTALRLSLPEVAGAQQAEVVETIWQATWEQGRDVASAEALVGVLDAAGFDGETLVARTRDDDVKDALRQRMERTIAAGVFGVPTFIVDGELFWGNDQRAFVEDFLRGERGYSDELLNKFLDAPYGVRRRG